MNTEDYVSYPIALALKACGFDEPCDHYYTPNKTLHIVKSNALAPEITNNRFLDEIDDGCCTAVPLWQAQKWLREKKKMHCQVLLNGVRSMYFWQVRELVGNGKYADSNRQYDVYEDALTDCLSAALDLLAGKEGER